MMASKSKDDFTLCCLHENIITTNPESGLVYSRRGLMRGTIHNNGYRVYCIYVRGIQKTLLGHRIIWMSKHGRIPERLMIDHINRNRADNRIHNLRLVDTLGNRKNAIINLPRGSRHWNCKISDESLVLLKKELETVEYGYQKVLAQKHGVAQSTISAIKHGNRR